MCDNLFEAFIKGEYAPPRTQRIEIPAHPVFLSVHDLAPGRPPMRGVHTAGVRIAHAPCTTQLMMRQPMRHGLSGSCSFFADSCLKTQRADVVEKVISHRRLRTSSGSANAPLFIFVGRSLCMSKHVLSLE